MSGDEFVGPSIPVGPSVGGDAFSGAPVMSAAEAKRAKVLASLKKKVGVAPQYCKSFMHRGQVLHSKVLPGTNFIATAGTDGLLQLWKIQPGSEVVFVKKFQVFSGAVSGLGVSPDGAWVSVCSAADRSFKVCDARSFDILSAVSVPFRPGRIETLVCKDGDVVVVVTDVDTPRVALFSFTSLRVGQTRPSAYVDIHKAPVASLSMDSGRGVAVSCDVDGHVKFWCPREVIDSARMSSSSAAAEELTASRRNIISDTEVSVTSTEGLGSGKEPESKRQVPVVAGFKAVPKITPGHPTAALGWELPSIGKDPFKMASKGTYGVSCVMAPGTNSGRGDSPRVCVYGHDQIVRVLDMGTGKMRVMLDERVKAWTAAQKAGEKGPLFIPDFRFGQVVSEWNSHWRGLYSRVEDPVVAAAAEAEGSGGKKKKKKDLWLPWAKTSADSRDSLSSHMHTPLPVCCFDEEAEHVVIPGLKGLKVVAMAKGRVLSCGGDEDVAVHFLGCSLQMARDVEKKSRSHRGEGGADRDPCPMVVAFARESDRFYLFNGYPPATPKIGDALGTSRDVYNEKPKQVAVAAAAAVQAKKALPRSATIHTTVGDIHLELFPQQAPRTVENFVTLANRGYYNDIIFHRVIPGFMVQTGCPLGTGVGGESCWGGDFEDEFTPLLQHREPFMLSMANKGPNTNSSQFFITVAPSLTNLDGKHTIFGKASGGHGTIRDIERLPTKSNDRPFDPPAIVSISCHEADN